MVKNLPVNAGDAGSIPGSERSPGGGNGSPLQYSCLENPMDRGVWRALVHGVAESQTGLNMRAHYINLKKNALVKSSSSPWFCFQPWRCPRSQNQLSIFIQEWECPCMHKNRVRCLLSPSLP